MRVLLLVACFLPVACSSSSSTSTNDAGPNSIDASVAGDGASGTGPAADANPGDQQAPSEGGGTEHTVTFGPLDVPPFTERTQCIVVHLGNATPIHVGQIHNLLGTSSHHMIVYRVNDTTEQPAPFDCQPFADTLNPTHGNPLMISQKKDDLLQLPSGVAFTLDANQMLRIEMHYINATAATTTLVSSTTMVELPDAQFQFEGSFLFVGDTNIHIPAMAAYTLGPKYFHMPSTYANSNFFAITGHEHQWGKNVQVWTATGDSDPGTPVYQVPGWLWSEPNTITFDPPFQVPPGGGLKFQCDWANGSANPVAFGESANDEMCFFWAYYYPSQGAAVCFHQDTDGGGLDLCCPGSPQLCASLNQATSSAGDQ